MIVPRYLVNNDEERATLVLSGVLSNPAIIGAVTRGSHLLLARNRRTTTNRHSLIAGFVEVGLTSG